MTFVPARFSALLAALDLSVNAAAADLQGDGSVVQRTGSRTNAAGAFTGGGTGNKSIRGISGYDGMPLGDLDSISFDWENIVGPAGPNYVPPEPATTVTPYVNLIVDFDPVGVGDIRVLTIITDQLATLISDSIGTYSNASNILSYSWANTQNTLIVLAPPNAVPGGVAPDVTVGASWLENSYKFSDLVAANPTAVLVDAYPGDGGLPVGAVVPAILILSGDSGTLIKSGKRIFNLKINGEDV